MEGFFFRVKKLSQSAAKHTTLHAFEQSYKRQIVIDTKSRNASHISSSSCLQILLFYPVLPTPRFKQLFFGGSYSKSLKNLKTYVFWRLFFDMQISRSCHYSPLFNQNIDCPSDTFLKFRNRPFVHSSACLFDIRFRYM